MIPLIQDHCHEIEALCRKYNVARLEVFGSAVERRFDESRSDVDFLIEFLPGQDLGPWLAHYFDFKAELERLLGRNVDLVMGGAMKNAYFIREVERTRRTVYATQNSEAARRHP